MPDLPNETTPAVETPLESWKEIALYLKRDVSTLKRWEKEEGLPIRRHLHHSRSSVYAYPSELDAWRAAREPDPEPATKPWWRPLRAIAAVAALVMALALAGDPAVPPAFAQQGDDLVVRRVWSGADVDWMGWPSADARLLTFVDWSTGDLAIRDLTTGQNRRLTNKGTWTQANEWAEYSVLSPDEKRVAYAWWVRDGYELRVMNIDGTGIRTLYRSDDLTYVAPSGWTPDGAQVLTVFQRTDRTNDIALVSVTDGTLRVVKTLDWRYPGRVTLSPDGRWIAYGFQPSEENPARDIFIIGAAANRESRAIDHPADDFPIGWSPDGTQLVFASDRTGSIGVFVQNIRDGKPAGAPRLIRKNVGDFRPIGISADGSLFYGAVHGRDVHAAAFDPAAGTMLSDPQNVAHRYIGTNFFPDWSADGRFLAYFSTRRAPQSATLVIRSLESGEEREIPLKIRPINHIRRSAPRWSPDGRTILVTGRDQKKGLGVFQIDAQTGVATPVTYAQVGRAEWCCQGKSVIYPLVEDSGIRPVRRDLDTGKETALYRLAHIHTAAVSPDGRWMALAVSPDNKGSQSTSPAMANWLIIVPTAGGAARQLLELPQNEEIKAVAWTPDSRHVLFGKHEGLPEDNPDYLRKVWRIPAAGGQPQLVHLPLTANELLSMRFHPDGKRIAFTVFGTQESEVWVMEKFLPTLRASE